MKPPRFLLWMGGIVFALLTSAANFAIAEDDDEGNENRGRNGDSGKDRDEEDRERDRPESPNDRKPRKPGHFVEQNGTLNGRYVDFRFDWNTCTVLNYRVHEVAFFDSIALPAPCEKAKSRSDHSQAAQLRIEADDAELQIHDNPNGLLRFEADHGSTLVFTLSPNVTVETTPRGLQLTAGTLNARLFLTDDEGRLQRNNQTVTVSNADGNFLVHPPQDDRPVRRTLHQAIQERKVGGEIDVLVDDGNVTSEVLAYDDVFIRVSQKNDSNYRFLVDSNLTEGRVFVVNFLPGAFKADKVGVRYYDLDEDGLPDEVPIHQSDDLADVLDIQPGEGPEYWIVLDENGRHVMVAVPQFSLHLVEIQGFGAQIVPTLLYGAVGGVLFVAVATLGLLRRRKE